MERKKHSVQDKYEFNKRNRGSDFSNGYVAGVEMYRDYGKSDGVYRRYIKELNRSQASAAKDKRDKWAIGYMCALRDCANERKGK